MTIGETIRKYRLAAGMTQQQVGEAIGLKTSHRQRLSDWETGGRVPSPRHLLKLMAVLHIPPEAFDEFKNIKNLKGEKTMKETIMVNGNEIEVTKYEPSAEFESINTIDDLDFDDLWTDGDYIYTFCGNDYQSIWHYC